MKPIKTLIMGASVLAIGVGALGVANAHAAQGTSKYVKDVDLEITGYAPVINIKNTSGKKWLKDLKLGVQENDIKFSFNGRVECKWNASLAEEKNKIYFGSVSLSNDTINTGSTLYKQGPIVLGEVGEVIEYGDETFTIPLNEIKNGHPALRIDPLAELEKERQAFNGSDLDFYKQDHELVLKRPLSAVATCMKKNNIHKLSPGYETQTATIQIKYKGDPNLMEPPKVNAQLANSPNQIQQNPNLPFQLSDVEFQPNMPNYVGKCLPDQNPKIRMNFNIAGGKQGQVDLRVKAVSNQYAAYGNYYETTGIVKNPKNGGGHLDFTFPLKEMMSDAKYSYMTAPEYLNKTINHNMRIEARFKNFDGSNQWSQWKEYDQAVFKHRCVPQLNGQLQGGINGGIGGYDNGNNSQGKAKLPTKASQTPSKPARALNKADPKPSPSIKGYIKMPDIDGESRD